MAYDKVSSRWPNATSTPYSRHTQSSKTREATRTARQRDGPGPVFGGIKKHNPKSKTKKKRSNPAKHVLADHRDPEEPFEWVDSHVAQVEVWLRKARDSGYHTRQQLGMLLFDRALDIEDYQQYREKQFTSRKNIWSEEIDKALVEGFLVYTPMGRKTKSYKDDTGRFGRNELLATFIRDRLGVDRDRKQISSHIQVLKAKFQHDPILMEFMCWGHHASKDPADDAFLEDLISNMSAQSTPRHISERTPPPSIDAMNLDLSAMRQAGRLFRLSYLELESAGATENHIYTGLSTPTCQPGVTRCQDWYDFSLRYPVLESLHRTSSLDCEVLVAHALLSLPNAELQPIEKKTSVMEITLQATLEYETLLPPELKSLRVRNSTYRNGVLEVEPGKTTSYEVSLIPHSEWDDGSEFSSPLQDCGLRVMLQEYTEMKERAHPTQKAAALDRANQDLQQYTIIQEVFEEGGSKQRLLVTCWTFSLTMGQEGKTTFHELHLPPPDHTLALPRRLSPLPVESGPSTRYGRHTALLHHDRCAMHTPSPRHNLPTPMSGLAATRSTVHTPVGTTPSTNGYDPMFVDPQLFSSEDLLTNHEYDPLLAEFDMNFFPNQTNQPPYNRVGSGAPQLASTVGNSTVAQQPLGWLDPRLQGDINSTFWDPSAADNFFAYPTSMASDFVLPTAWR